MILAIDTSALVLRYLPGDHRELVLTEMEQIDVWCASELVRAEVLLTLHRASISPTQNMALSTWDTYEEHRNR